ncbi:hypothetical protein EIP91_004439 [Steccherinum ochraceum]|uniref:F-box domain-containing protein n=1 Tax=Steccherinum ochraceum TaxID=92696 RepID=A0A4R0RF21_9APHY|nr:hypothetical protein EIP91_004439 [Steccherinum ochraceum]
MAHAKGDSGQPVSSPPFTSTLSQELLDRVIDHLHTDKASLQACALVARRWLSVSRLHLFEKTSVKGWSQDDFKLFRDHLLAPDNGISFCIRDLSLVGKGYALGGPNVSSSFPRLCKHTLQDIVLHLPNLRTLHLLRLRPAGCVDDCQSRPLLPRSVNLDSLTLRIGSAEDPLQEIVEVFRLFGEVQNLHALSVDWQVEPETQPQSILRDVTTQMAQPNALPSQLRVHSLASAAPKLFYLLPALASTETRDSLTSLEIGPLRIGVQVETLRDFLHKLGPTFSRLYLAMGEPISIDLTDHSGLSLRTAPTLSILVLPLNLRLWESPEHGRWRCTRVLDALASASGSTTIRYINFHFKFDVPWVLGWDSATFAEALSCRMDWVGLKEVLQTFPNLVKARMLLMDDPGFFNDFQATITANLARLVELNLLEIQPLPLLKDEWRPVFWWALNA